MTDAVLLLILLAFLLTTILPVVLLALHGAWRAVNWWARRGRT